MQAKKVVVTGGAGFIGSNLVSLLLKKSYQVLVIDDFSIGSIKNLPKHPNLKIARADIRNKELMVKYLKGVDAVFHLAVQCVRKSINDPEIVHQVNATGTLNMLDAALKNKVKKFVYVSSSEVYGTAIKVPMSEDHPLNPTTVYGASKLVGEYYTLAYLRSYGLPVVIVRPFNTYGYNEHFEGPYGEVIPRFVVRALNNLPVQVFGDGQQTRDFTFVDDTVRGIYQVYKLGEIGEIYNIAHGQEIKIIDLARYVFKSLKVEGQIEHLPSRPGDVLRLYANTQKAEHQLNYQAEINIEEGLLKYLKWFKAVGFNPKKMLITYQDQNW